MNDFFHILREIKLRHKIINKEDYQRICSTEETAIWLDLVRGTSIEIIGNKNVNINSFGNEKLSVSIMLCVNATGIKLPPFITV